MKKLLLLLIVVFTSVLSYSQEYIDYKIRTDDFYANTSWEASKADPTWHFRIQVGNAYSSGAWSGWVCVHDDNNLNYSGGGWYSTLGFIERWSGTVLSNADNIYIGIEGWEDDSDPDCSYGGNDEDYSSDTYDYHSDLSGSIARNSWLNFKNAQQSNVDYADCGSTSGTINDYYKAEFDVWWNYSIPVNPTFTITDLTSTTFNINLTNKNNYRITDWDYQVSTDNVFTNVVASFTEIIPLSTDVTSGLAESTTYYIKIRGGNEAGTGSYTSYQTITTLSDGTWTGTTDTDWATANNWAGGSVPLFSTDVIVPAGETVIISPTNSASCNNLTVETGATFIINSDASNNGSLIVGGTSSGNITYNRWMTYNKWHLVAAPVGGQTIDDFITANTTYLATSDTKHGLSPYNNSTPAWAHYTTSNTAGSFDAGKGYETMRTTTDGAFAFTGAVVTDNVSIGITDPESPGNPWNLVGNPYPSALCANTHASTATAATENLVLKNTDELDAGEYQAVYVWDANAATPDYITVNQSSGATYIAPGQAFFVYSKTSGGTFSFTEDMQTHQTGDIFKSGTIANPAIKLFAERSEGTSSTNIKYIDNMTTGLDPGYDGGRFSAGDNSFAIYTHLVGDETNLVDFDIQCLPAYEFNHVVPVGLNAPANTEVVFRAQTENLASDVPVYLEDKLTGKFTALHESGSFYAASITEQSEGIGRFYLHTKSVATGISC